MESSKVRRGIGLVAHDAMKKDLIEWVLWNVERETSRTGMGFYDFEIRAFGWRPADGFAHCGRTD